MKKTKNKQELYDYIIGNLCCQDILQFKELQRKSKPLLICVDYYKIVIHEENACRNKAYVSTETHAVISKYKFDLSYIILQWEILDRKYLESTIHDLQCRIRELESKS